MDGVFALDVSREDLVRFTNACESDGEDSVNYASFVVELAAAAGALSCYVTYNEFLLRNDPNRSPFRGVPLIDTNALFASVRAEDITGVVGQRFPLHFDFSPMVKPYFMLEPVPENEVGKDGQSRACDDMVLASENAKTTSRSYLISVGDDTMEDIIRFLFLPKSASASGNSLLGRQDYRLLKRQKIESE
jgi:hypothetical protein